MKQGDDILDTFIDAHFTRLYDQLRVRRLLIGLIYTGETLDLTTTCALVQTLGIPTLTDLNGRVYVALEERQSSCLM